MLNLKRSKSRLKNDFNVNLNLSSNMVGSFNGETNFSHKLLLNNTQLS